MAGSGLFLFLDGVSPWIWIALGVAIGVAEMLTLSYFLIGPSLAAFAIGALLFIAPGTGGDIQVAVFAVLSVVFTLGGRSWLLRRRPEGGTPGLNRRSELMIGRRGRALADFERGEGIIVIDDVRWNARLGTGEALANAGLQVTGADGLVLICEPG